LFPALAVKVYLAICVEWAKDHCAVGLTSIDPLLTKLCTKRLIWVTVIKLLHQ